MQRFLSRAGWPFVAGLLFLFIAVGAILLQKDSPPNRSSDTTVLHEKKSPSSFKRDFSLFRSTPEFVPLALREQLRLSQGQRYWQRSQRLSSVPVPTWVLPGSVTTCLVARDPEGLASGSTCSRNDRVLDHGLVLSFLAGSPSAQPPGTRRIVLGLVPDVARKVLIRTLGHAPALVPVKRNSFFLLDGVNNPPESTELKP